MSTDTKKAGHKLINRCAVRTLLLEQYKQWGHATERKNIAASVVKETFEHLEASAQRYIISIAAQGFPGRKGGARGCGRDRNTLNNFSLAGSTGTATPNRSSNDGKASNGR